MGKIKTNSNPTPTSELGKALEKINVWDMKNKTIKKEMSILLDIHREAITNLTTLPILSFLLKMQLIEYEIKQSLIILDELVVVKLIQVKATVVRIKRKQQKIEKLPLGLAIAQFLEYDNDYINSIRTDLNDLNKARNNFAHHLFHSPSSIVVLQKEAMLNIVKADKVIEVLNQQNSSLRNDVITYMKDLAL